MIDTDKYAGHTPAEWMKTMSLNGLYSHILQTCLHSERWLIEDAPLLLAEVKRLREELQKVCLHTDYSMTMMGAVCNICGLEEGDEE